MLTPIQTDGLLNETVWQEADMIQNLTQVEPLQGEQATYPTTVRVLADEDFIAIGIEVHQPGHLITAYTRERDLFMGNQDYIKFVFDTFLDGRSGYVFAITPEGARYDALINPDGEENDAWDSIWEAKTVRTEYGWSAEILIPTKSLMFDEDSPEWGFNIERQIVQLQELNRWSGAARNYRITQMSVAGTLNQLPELTLGRGISATPAVTFGGGKPASNVDAKGTFEPSIDISKSFGSNLSSTLTFNTDFAATEVDDRQTNLTRFSQFLPEKRSFFLDGSDIFNFGLGLNRDVIPFFSRRIGLVDGREVPILAGGKLSGRIGDTSVSGLITHTGEVNGVAPTSTMSAIRLKQNILSESRVGLIATAGDPNGLNNSWMTGVDLTLATSRFLGDKNLVFGIWGLISNREDLADDQTALGAQLAYPNDLWSFTTTIKRLGENFQPSMGFVPRMGVIMYDTNVEFAPRPNISWVRQVSAEVRPELVTDLSGNWESYSATFTPLGINFESGDFIEFEITPSGEQLTDPFTIAEDVSIPTGSYHFIRYEGRLELASQRIVGGDFSYGFGSFYEGTLQNIESRLFWHPAPALDLSMRFERNIGRLPQGDFDISLAGVELGLFPSPDFSMISFIQYDTESKDLGTNTRVEWSFNPYGKVYAIYNHNINNSLDRFRFEGNSLLIKLQYTLRY